MGRDEILKQAGSFSTQADPAGCLFTFRCDSFNARDDSVSDQVSLKLEIPLFPSIHPVRFHQNQMPLSLTGDTHDVGRAAGICLVKFPFEEVAFSLQHIEHQAGRTVRVLASSGPFVPCLNPGFAAEQLLYSLFNFQKFLLHCLLLQIVDRRIGETFLTTFDRLHQLLRSIRT